MTELAKGGEIPAGTLIVERVQTGVRVEKRMIKVLKGLAEYLDLSLGDLLEGMILHAFAGKDPFSPGTRRRIHDLKQVYGMAYGVEASHRLGEKAAGEEGAVKDGEAAAPGPIVSRDDLTDEGFLRAFESGSLAAAPFHHPHHIRMAWLYLKENEPEEVIGKVRQGIGMIARAHGKPDHYNETITMAYLRILKSRLRGERPPRDWAAFSAANPDLFAWPSPLLEVHYSPRRLHSAEARRSFLDPDRDPLP